MADAVQLQIGRAAGEVVEQQHRAVLAGEVLLESENLAPVAQRVLGEKPHLGQAIEDDALRLHRLHLVEDRLHGLAKLDLPGMEQRLLLVERQGPLGRGELEQVDAVERPVMARRDGAQLLLGFGERDVEAGLAEVAALEQELQRQRGLAGAGRALDEIDAIGEQAAAQHVVEAGDAGRGAGRALQHGGMSVVHGLRRIGRDGGRSLRRRQAVSTP